MKRGISLGLLLLILCFVLSSCTIPKEWVLFAQNDFSSTITETGFNQTITEYNEGTFILDTSQCKYTGTQISSWAAVYTSGLSINSDSGIKITAEPISFSEMDQWIEIGIWKQIISEGYAFGAITPQQIQIGHYNGSGGTEFLVHLNHGISDFTKVVIEVVIENAFVTVVVYNKDDNSVIKSASASVNATDIGGNAAFRCDGNGEVKLDNITIYSK